MKNQNILLVDAQPVEVMRALGYRDTKYQELFQESLEVANLQRVDPIIQQLPDFQNFDGIIVSGSKYSVYESYSWQDILEKRIREAVERQIPFLGVCYGHQALVKAFGGVIEKDKNGKEFGVAQVILTDEGKQHLLFADVPLASKLYTSHADSVIELSSQLTTLATNKDYPIQAVSIGTNAVGIQAHPEFDKAFMVSLVQYYEQTKKIVQEEAEHVLSDINKCHEEVEQTRKRIFKNFLTMISNKS